MKSERTRPPSDRSGRYAFHALGVSAGVAFAVALFGFGGVHTETRVAVHVLLGLAALVAVAQPRAVLARCGRVATLIAAGGMLLLAGCAGLLPLPAFLGRLVAPAWLEERGAHVAWGFASVRVEDTVTALTHLLLPLGFAAVAGVWAVSVRRRTPIEDVVLATTAAVLAVSALHVLFEQRALFGLFQSEAQLRRLFAPFVNPNHYGGFLLLGFPLALGTALDETATPRRRQLGGVVAASTVVCALWAGSGGPLLLLGVQAAALLVRTGTVHWLAVAACAVPAPFLAALWAGRWGGDALVSLSHRFDLWRSSVAMLADHWLFGTGAGTYGFAVSPYRTDHAPEVWLHAHNDWLEWAATTGLVGVVTCGVAAFLVRPRASSRAARASRLSLGVAGVLLHATFDFPLQIPAIAMGVAALAAWRTTAFHDEVRASPAVLRLALTLIAAAELGAGAWNLRNRVVEPAADALLQQAGDLARARDVVGLLAPWRYERKYDVAVQAAKAGDPAGAAERARALALAHPAEADAQRSAALVLARAKDLAGALEVVERAVARAPWDWRNWALRARIVEALDPVRAPEAWADALLAGVPGALEAGWRRLPLGLYWVHVAERAPLPLRLSVAEFVARQDDPEAAIVGYEAVVRERPHRFHPVYVDLLVGAGRLEEARRHLSTVLAHDPGLREAARRLATVEEQLGNWEEARRIWASLEGRVPEARIRMVLALERLEGPERALSVLDQRALSGDRLRPHELIERARLLSRLGRHGECVRVLATGDLARDPRHGAAARALQDTCTRGGP